MPLKTTTKHFLNSNRKHISKTTNLSLKPQTSIINRIKFVFTTTQILLKCVQILHDEGDFGNVPLPKQTLHRFLLQFTSVTLAHTPTFMDVVRSCLMMLVIPAATLSISKLHNVRKKRFYMRTMTVCVQENELKARLKQVPFQHKCDSRFNFDDSHCVATTELF